MSAEGNETQIYVRFLIARLLYEHQTRMTEQAWSLYTEFVKPLRPGDVVLTFNYDTILESACYRAQVKYRLCPARFAEVRRHGGGFLRSFEDEVIICKLHGSIDWFSRERYERDTTRYQRNPLHPKPRHRVFDNEKLFRIEPLASQPYPQNDPFFHLYRARNLAPLFSDADEVSPTPFLIAPSYSKIVYLNPLLGFWYDFNSMGVSKSQLIVIGFSFPNQDEYAMAPVVKAISNFQRHNDSGDRFTLTRLKLVDFQPTPVAQEQFRSNKPFIDWTKTACFWNGLSPEIMEAVVEPSTFQGKYTRKTMEPTALRETPKQSKVVFPNEPSGDMSGTSVLKWNVAEGIDRFAAARGVDLTKWCPIAVKISGSNVSIFAASIADYNQVGPGFINMMAHQDDGIIHVHELDVGADPTQLLFSLGDLDAILVRTDLGALEELRRIGPAT